MLRTLKRNGIQMSDIWILPAHQNLIILLAGWFPQITCRQHKDIYKCLLSSVFQVHSITGCLQQLCTAE